MGEVCSQQITNATSLAESACVQFVDQLPRFKGKFNFQKLSSIHKIERAAIQFCLTNNIDRMHVQLIIRLLAYNHHHYFAAFKRLAVDNRQNFLEEASQINVELVDSLVNHFLQKQNKLMNPYTTIGIRQFLPAPIIKVNQVKYQNKLSLEMEGLHLLKIGKVGIIIMVAGNAEKSKHTSKAFRKLPFPGNPTILQLLFKRLHNLMKEKVISKSKFKIKIEIPMILACSKNNQQLFKKYLEENNYFGFDQRFIRVLQISQWALVNQYGKLCLNFQFKTLTWPQGSAKCLELVLQNRVKSFLKYHKIEYLHILGCDNIAQIPGDPFLLGVTHKLERQISAKCTPASNIFQKKHRYVRSENNFHLLNFKQMQFLNDNQLLKQSPVALNSMVFKLDNLLKILQDYQFDLYMSRRYHLVQTKQNYHDFQQYKPILDAKCYAFQKDVRDYVACSPQTILVQYDRCNYIQIDDENLSQNYIKFCLSNSLFE